MDFKKGMRKLCIELHDEAVDAVKTAIIKSRTGQPPEVDRVAELDSIIQTMQITLTRIKKEPDDWSQVIKLKALCSTWLELFWQD